MYQRNNRLSCCSRPRKRSSAPDPDGVFGIDFWHAVEFSRIGRAPRSGLSARSRGNRSNLPRWFAGVKLAFPLSTPARDAPPRPRSRCVSRVVWPPRERPPSGVRHSLPGDVENTRQSARASANRLVSGVRGPTQACSWSRSQVLVRVALRSWPARVRATWDGDAAARRPPLPSLGSVSATSDVS
jgi:hypothetical protein